jgi:hypothetical protein
MTLGRSKPRRMSQDDMTQIKCQIPGYGEVAIDVPGTDPEDVRDTFIEWLVGDEKDGDWRTVHASIDGKKCELTFRASWVAGFRI